MASGAVADFSAVGALALLALRKCVEIFIHDSLHTYGQMYFELKIAFDAVWLRAPYALPENFINPICQC